MRMQVHEDERPSVIGQVEGAGDRPADETRMLLEFVRHRDVPCPLCGYNLRNLTTPRCPECQNALRLSVGLYELRVGWLVATLTPCTFSGICAAMLLVPIVLAALIGGAGLDWPVLALDAFGWLSFLTGTLIFAFRRRFLAQEPNQQAAWAVLIWLTHLAAFALVVALAIR